MDKNDTKWKQKYLTALDKHEKKERNWTDLEDMLRLGMTRVALAAEGVDEKLDKQLNSLRKSIRSGNYDSLEYIVEDISQSVKRIDEKRNVKQASVADLPTALLQLTETLTFSPAQKKPLQALQKQLKKTGAEQSIDDALRQLSSLINSAQTTAATSPKEQPVTTASTPSPEQGLLGKWFGSSDTPAKPGASETPNSLSVAAGVLNQMLQGLHKATNGSKPVEQLSGLLAKANNERSLYDISNRLVQLIDTTLKHNSAQSTAKPAAESPSEKVTDSNTATKDSSRESIKEGPDQQNNTEAAMPDPSLIADAETSPGPVHMHPATPEQQPAIAGFCLTLLEHLHLPAEFEKDVQKLRDKIVSKTDAPESATMLNEIADLITATRARAEKEKQDLQNFLRQLTGKLEDIDSHLAGAEDNSKNSLTNGKKLGDAVEVQMKSIETTVQEAPESGQLKMVVQQHLDTIREHIIHYQEGEDKNQRTLLDELSKSNMRLHKLEQEAEQLRVRLSEEHDQALQDKLTGIYNRLAYEERLEQEYQRWKRYKKPLSFLVFDIDHFKNINDTYGHRAGDKALRLIAQTLKKKLRATDFLGRYGGEEFVVLMPETVLSEAMSVANKLREAVLNVRFNYQQTEVSITVSCGASEFRKDDLASDVFQRADKALYRAKQNGRNQCQTSDT